MNTIQKWEYECFYVSRHYHKQIARLNELGLSGWQFCYKEFESSDEYFGVFKRPIISKEDDNKGSNNKD